MSISQGFLSATPACENGSADECECDEQSENSWISGDLLYWRTREDGFGCAFGSTEIETAVSNGMVVTDISERDGDIDFDWELGFSLGVGHDFDCSCWGTSVYWTHFNEAGRGHDCNNHAKWKLRFDEVDAVWGYKLNCGSFFGFRPFFGARYAQINQSLSTHLVTEILDSSTGESSIVVSIKKGDEYFWGAGPLLGFEAEFSLGCGFSVYGDLAGAFLYGNFKDKFYDSDLFTTTVNNCHSIKNTRNVLTCFDAGLGVRYEWCRVAFQLGLEHHSYFNFNHIGCCADLNLYGVNASAIVRF
ncbi:MAG: Lpg1974 family pore-forming outer membrane protein [Parachlamydiaceae bacterium]